MFKRERKKYMENKCLNVLEENVKKIFIYAKLSGKKEIKWNGKLINIDKWLKKCPNESGQCSLQFKECIHENLL
ncbi:MAG: hypothetical protein ACYC6W_10925 [Nitrosotalea sp.]